MIYVFIDESEDSNIFVVGGVATSDKDKLSDGIFDTRRYVKNKKGLSEKQKSKILNELKDFVLNGSFEDIKAHFIRSITLEKIKSRNKDKDGTWQRRECIRVFGIYYTKKDGEYFNQKRKEDVYKACIMKALEILEPFCEEMGGIELVYDITYDQFGDSTFGDHLKNEAKNRYPCVSDIRPGKSNEIKELQAADICIGCVRRSFNKEDLENFSVLQESAIIAEVDISYDPLEYIK